MSCCGTAPTAASEASVMMHVGAPGSGCTSKVALARASLTLLKAVSVVSLQATVLGVGLGIGQEQMQWME